jgi:hypothetical protein
LILTIFAIFTHCLPARKRPCFSTILRLAWITRKQPGLEIRVISISTEYQV